MTINQPILTSIHSIYAGLIKSLIFIAAFFVVSCSDWPTNNTLTNIQIELWYDRQELKCGQYLEHDSLNWGVEQLAFFISDLHLVQAENQAPLILTTNDWQRENSALIRFANSDCATDKLASSELQNEESSAQPFKSLQLTQSMQLTDDSYLSFTLGLPFEVNHLNPLGQPPPLNMPSMFWSWQGGHKFLRVDMVSEGQAWAFHLGSTGCASASAMRSPQASCINPNTVQLTLAKQQQGQRLIIHLNKLLQGVELNTKSSCLMQPDKSSCQLLMVNLANNGVFEWR